VVVLGPACHGDLSGHLNLFHKGQVFLCPGNYFERCPGGISCPESKAPAKQDFASGVLILRNIFTLFAVLAASGAVPAVAADDAQPAAESAQVEVKKGDHIYDANGKHIGRVYQLSTSGDPQIIRGITLVTVPVATVSLSDGKLVTSLTRAQLTK
jgi:hypothetical protein